MLSMSWNVTQTTFTRRTRKIEKNRKNNMTSNNILKFVLFALSTYFVLQVVCENDGDTSIINAAESENWPDYENNNARMECRETEEYSRCEGNPLCQRNCDNLNAPGVPCLKRSCIEGCVCKDTFVRSELNGGCIPQDQCGRVKH